MLALGSRDSRVAVELLIYSVYVCPFCYIDSVRVDRLVAEGLVEPVWLPFELHPEVPSEGIPRDEYFPPAHRARFDAVHRALFKAHWEGTANLDSMADLRRLAEAAGLDGEGLDAALDEGRYEE